VSRWWSHAIVSAKSINAVASSASSIISPGWRKINTSGLSSLGFARVRFARVEFTTSVVLFVKVTWFTHARAVSFKNIDTW